MATAVLPKTTPTPDGLRRLADVVLFKAGSHTGMNGVTKNYGPDYVKAVADNYKSFLTDPELHVEPPAVLGHEGVQAKLAEILAGDDVYKRVFADRKPTSGGGPGRTDQPAAGWPTNVRFDQSTGHLVGDLERIPPSIGDMIDTGQLRFPSVEFKEDLVKAGKAVGPVLWRVALLGGTPPGCKTIPPLGESHFADAGVVYFADGDSSMTDAEKAAADKAAADKAAADKVAADKLAADKAAADKAAADKAADAAKAAPVTLSDTDRKAITEAVRADMVSAFADQQKLLIEQAAAIKAAADSALTNMSRREAEERRKAVHEFCEAELLAGRISPWELDKNDPENLESRLATIPATETVCFADAQGKEVRKTRLQAEMDAIRKRPVRMFGERLTGTVNDERTGRQKRIADWYKSRSPAKTA